MSQEAPQHRKSLGYVVDAERRDQPMIVFGLEPSGERVWIDDAARGGAEGLLCECGAPLIAEEGDIREQHFAHKAGGNRSCAIAAQAALVRFVREALDGATIDLPLTKGKHGVAKVHAINEMPEEPLPTFRIAAQEGRQLIAVFRIKRKTADVERFRQLGISAVEVDLRQHRNASDEGIRHAIRSASPRQWLFWRMGFHGIDPPRLASRAAHRSSLSDATHAPLSNKRLFELLFGPSSRNR